MVSHNIRKDGIMEVTTGKLNTVSLGNLISQKTRDVQSMIKNERGRWDIILEMLKATQMENDPGNRHSLHEEFSLKKFENYFDFLQNEGFIAEFNPGNNYYLTEKGKRLLEGLNKINNILGDNAELIKLLIPALFFINGSPFFPGWGS